MSSKGDLCDPSVQDFKPQLLNDVISIRPDGEAFGSLIVIYIGQITAPMNSLVVTFVIMNMPTNELPELESI